MSSDGKPVCSTKAEVIIENGKVSFGDGCIIHPKAKIIVEGDCSIIFGQYNIIEENVVIKVTPRYSALLKSNEQITIYVGNYNYFKVGCYLENTTVENHNTFDYRCRLDNSQIESRCVITPGITLPKFSSVKAGLIVIDNQILRVNSHFNEEDFVNTIKEMYKILSVIIGQKKK